MRFEIERDDASGLIRFRGELSAVEIARLNLDHIDRAVIGSPADTAADHLQSLEIIYRRHHEQEAAP